MTSPPRSRIAATRFPATERSARRADATFQWLEKSFEGKFILGEVLFVAHLDELFLEGFVDGRALPFAVESGEVFFFAAGVDGFEAADAVGVDSAFVGGDENVGASAGVGFGYTEGLKDINHEGFELLEEDEGRHGLSFYDRLDGFFEALKPFFQCVFLFDQFAGGAGHLFA